MDQPARQPSRRFKRQTRGSGPRKKLTRYKRDKSGKIICDDAGRPIVDHVEYRGHGWHQIDGESVPSRWVTAPTRAELNRILDRLLDEDQQAIATGSYSLVRGRLIPKPPPAAVVTMAPVHPVPEMTLNDAISAAIESPRARRSDQTVETYKQRWQYVRARVHPNQMVPLGEIPLSKLTYDHLAEWDECLTDRLSPKSFAEARNLLRTAVNFVIQNRDLYPDVKVSFHPGDYSPRRAWSTAAKKQVVAARDEYGLLVSACGELIAEDPDYGWQGMQALITLVRHCLRPSEAVALKWSDWDDQAGGFRIEREIVALRGGEVVRESLKTEASRDLVLIAENLREYVMQSQTIGSIWVVPSPTDSTRWLASSSRARRWTTLKKRAGIDPQTDLYSLKHGMIRDLFLAGKKADQIMLLTRHTTPAMIRQVYASLEKSALVKEINKMHE